MAADKDVEDLEKRITEEVATEFGAEEARQRYQNRLELAIHAMRLAEQGDVSAAKEQLLQIIHDHEAYQPGRKWTPVYGYDQLDSVRLHYLERSLERTLEESRWKGECSENEIKEAAIYLVFLKANEHDRAKLIEKYGGMRVSDIEKRVRHPEKIAIYDRRDVAKAKVKDVLFSAALPLTYARKRHEQGKFDDEDITYTGLSLTAQTAVLTTLAFIAPAYLLPIAAALVGGGVVYEGARWVVKRAKALSGKGKDEKKRLLGEIGPQLPPKQD